MRPNRFLALHHVFAWALLLANTAAWSADGCPSLSGCAYQAGRGLPGSDQDTRQPAPTAARPPVIVNSCDAGGCTDPNLTRYPGREGELQNGVYLDPQGRRCVRSGDRLECG